MVVYETTHLSKYKHTEGECKMMITEGITLTRGTKKIIQEAIDTLDTPFKNDRIRITEQFCHIVGERYTGGAMNYQLERMGNTYPFTVLERNDWSIQDALESELSVSLSENWFVDNQLKKVNGEILQERKVSVVASDNDNETLIKGLEAIRALDTPTSNDLLMNGLTVTVEETSSPALATTIWENVSDDTTYHLEEKLYWLRELEVGRDDNNDPIHLSTDDILNYSKAQAKAQGFKISKDSNIKKPLSTTAPIMEAIDKYLYDKTGQFVG